MQPNPRPAAARPDVKLLRCLPLLADYSHSSRTATRTATRTAPCRTIQPISSVLVLDTHGPPAPNSWYPIPSLPAVCIAFNCTSFHLIHSACAQLALALELLGLCSCSVLRLGPGLRETKRIPIRPPSAINKKEPRVSCFLLPPLDRSVWTCAISQFWAFSNPSPAAPFPLRVVGLRFRRPAWFVR